MSYPFVTRKRSKFVAKVISIYGYLKNKISTKSRLSFHLHNTSVNLLRNYSFIIADPKNPPILRAHPTSTLHLTNSYLNGSVVRIKQNFCQSNNLSSSVPSVGAVDHDWPRLPVQRLCDCHSGSHQSGHVLQPARSFQKTEPTGK